MTVRRYPAGKYNPGNLPVTRDSVIALSQSLLIAQFNRGQTAGESREGQAPLETTTGGAGRRVVFLRGAGRKGFLILDLRFLI